MFLEVIDLFGRIFRAEERFGAPVEIIQRIAVVAEDVQRADLRIADQVSSTIESRMSVR